MKLKKITQILPPYETITIWGNNEDIPIWKGNVEDIPYIFMNMKLTEGPDGGYIDVRYGCSDCEDHVAVFVEDE